MSAMILMAVIAASAGLGLYLVHRLDSTDHPMLGLFPLLLIIGLVILILSFGDNLYLILGASVFVSTFCAATWFSFRAEGKALVRPGNSAGSADANLPADSQERSQSRRRSFTWVAPGVRKTSRGNLVRLEVVNDKPNASSRRRNSTRLTSVN
ncbi:MAG: hypothetical protein R3F51_23410 [Cyanobacteriota/Melainabacteria group bacterium]